MENQETKNEINSVNKRSKKHYNKNYNFKFAHRQVSDHDFITLTLTNGKKAVLRFAGITSFFECASDGDTPVCVVKYKLWESMPEESHHARISYQQLSNMLQKFLS